MKGKKAKRKKKVPEGIDPFVGCESVPDGWVEMREYHSRVSAEFEHGEKLVRRAYAWLDAGMRKKDPRAREIYAEVMARPHPYGALVDFFTRRSVVSSPKRSEGIANVVQFPPGLERQPAK